MKIAFGGTGPRTDEQFIDEIAAEIEAAERVAEERGTMVEREAIAQEMETVAESGGPLYPGRSWLRVMAENVRARSNKPKGGE